MDEYIILDLNKQREKFRSNKPTFVRQGEIDSAPLDVQITLDGEPYDLTGCNVYFEAERSDGRKFVEAVGITSAENGFVSHTVPAGLMLGYGKTELAYFSVYTPDEAIITTETMDIVTLPGICMFTDSDFLPYIEKIIHELEVYLEDAERMSNDVDDVVQRANQALSDVNEAVSKSENAVFNAEAATTDAEYWANLAQAAIQNIHKTISEAVSQMTGIYLESKGADALDTLARNVCTSGILIGETIYIKSSQVAVRSDGTVYIKGSHYSNGRLRFPTVRCSAAQALQLVNLALEQITTMAHLQSLMALQIAELQKDNEQLNKAIRTLSLNAGGYPFLIGETIYTKGVTRSSGIVKIPKATYANGRMRLNPM